MRIRKIFVDFEKEENWLNLMSEKGFALVDYSFLTYTFEKSQPGEYIYRIELLEQMPSHDQSLEYINFCQELGIEKVATYFRWIYFRKKADQGAFEIFSDNNSKILHIKRIILFQGIIGVANLLTGINNLNIGRYSKFNGLLGIFSILLGCYIGYLCMKNLKKIRRLSQE